MLTEVAAMLIALIDYMAFTRGSKADWDRWAKVTGDDGWTWDSLQPYMRKVRTGVSLQIFITLIG